VGTYSHSKPELGMDRNHTELLANSHEEIFLDHEIYIQPSRDTYRGGFEWSVCRAGLELDAGLDFTVEDALQQAKSAAAALRQRDTSL
jgi:hypothetical protein